VAGVSVDPVAVCGDPVAVASAKPVMGVAPADTDGNARAAESNRGEGCAPVEAVLIERSFPPPGVAPAGRA